MFGKKRFFGILISTLLLLIFSATILPFDFLHNHKTTAQCSEKTQSGPCHHKLHLNEKNSFCWVCAIHFDKTFTKIDVREQIASLPVFSALSENKATAFFTDLIFSALRGPPSE